MMNDLPNFTAWTNENLARFAEESYVRMQNQQERIEEMQMRLKNAAEAINNLRKILGPWND
jgi:hypothetical protein